MHRILHKILSTLALAAIVGVCAAPADAHFSVHRAGKLFYFDGSAYTNKGASPASVGDPVDITFTQNRKRTQTATLSNINGAFAQHWTGPGHMSSTASCISPPFGIPGASDEYIAWRAFRKYNYVDVKDVQVEDEHILNGSVKSVFAACSDEYHIRWWTDGIHRAIARGADPHGSLDQWLLGGAHHESRPPAGKHYIDRPWDQVRDEVLRYMGTYYCHRRHFRYDPGSYGFFGKKPHRYFHDGWIGEISLQAEAQGC